MDHVGPPFHIYVTDRLQYGYIRCPEAVLSTSLLIVQNNPCTRNPVSFFLQDRAPVVTVHSPNAFSQSLTAIRGDSSLLFDER